MSEDLKGSDNLADGSVNYIIQNTINDNIARAVAGRATIDFSSDANLTLSTTEGSDQWRDKVITFTDTGVVLTAGRDVVFPDKDGPVPYLIVNDTAQTLTCKLSGQAGVAITASSSDLIWYDGTDMVAY